MVPIELQLTNFLSYREQVTLPFAGIHLACISGENGAGKSSLLEAMTWSLFGKSRSRSDDDVVNRLAAVRGEQADVTFRFAQEGQTYRVRRRKKPGGRTYLDFHLREEDDWKTLSEGRVRETQAAIEETLGMNYDTFAHASFFLQGQADSFTTETPARRKDVLADLLGVTRWDTFKEIVSQRRRQAETDLTLTDARLSEYVTELEQADARRAALEQAQAALDALSERLAAQEKLLYQLRRTSEAAAQQRKLRDNLAQAVERARRTLTQLEATRRERAAERQRQQALIAEADTIRAEYEAFEAAEATLAAWQTRAEAYSALQAQRRPHELALERARSRLQQSVADLRRRAAEMVTLQAAQAASTAEIARVRAEIDKHTRPPDASAALREALNTTRRALEGARQSRALAQQAWQQLNKQAEDINAREATQAGLAQQLADAAARLEALQAEMAELRAAQDRSATCRARLNAIEADSPRLRGQMDKIKERLDQLQQDSGSTCPLCGQPLTEAHRTNVLADLRQEGTALGDQYRANRDEKRALEQELAGLDQTLQHTRRIERAVQTQQQAVAQLTARQTEQAAVIKKWHDSDQPARLNALAAELAQPGDLPALQQKMDALEAALREEEAHARALTQHEKRLTQLETQAAEQERALTEWAESGAPRLAELEQTLADDRFEPDARAALAALDKETAAVGYDSAQHAAARAARAAVAHAPERYQALQRAEAALEPLSAAIDDLDTQIEAQRAEVASVEESLAEAAAQLAAFEADAGDLEAAEQTVFALREERTHANRHVGAAEQRLSVIDDVRVRSADLKDERVQLTRQIERLKLLERACGRDGVQGLLIERALPEIEDRANEILDRLTEGGMRIAFETQRQLKSRDAKVETLDIRIVDNNGERPYENYSGGEQFRINFAIRLALSQILARRAGARLRTLVIDEGFGSQDPFGRQRLIEAINTIQGDFACILVITHVDALRDAFPTRIEVFKTPDGSRLSVGN